MDGQRRIGRWVAAAALLAATVGLGGCGTDEGSAAPGPDTAAGPEVGLGSSLRPRDLPAREPLPFVEDSAEGAIRFVVYWLVALGRSYRTGDVRDFARMHTDDCEVCRGFEQVTRDRYRDGGSISGPNWSLSKIGWSAPLGDGRALGVMGRLHIPRLVFRSAEGEVTRSEPERLRFSWTLTRRDDGWIITDARKVEVIDSEELARLGIAPPTS
jgi:hypothetical protein